MSDKDKKQLVQAFVQFLNQDIQSGGLGEDAKESLEVAAQCLDSAYGLTDQATSTEHPVPLLDIFKKGLEHYHHEQGASSKSQGPLADKAMAERKKTRGNELLKEEKYEDAIQCYTEAIDLDPSNAVYFSNRAAAYIKLEKHQEALSDTERAIAIDPKYSKAHGRRGLALTGLERYQEAREAYQTAQQLDPENQSYRQNLEITEQKLREQTNQAGMPGLGGLNLGNMDLGSLLQNPALMNMATQMMSSPQMQQMMAGMMAGAQDEPSGQQGIGNLLQVGQQLAQQIQQQNPELVEQLRNQTQRPSQDPGNEGGNQS